MNWLFARPVRFVLLLSTVMIILAAWLSVALGERVDACMEKGGIIVKTIDGWRCIDAKVLK